MTDFEAEKRASSFDEVSLSRECPGDLTRRILHQWLAQRHHTYQDISNFYTAQKR